VKILEFTENFSRSLKVLENWFAAVTEMPVM